MFHLFLTAVCFRGETSKLEVLAYCDTMVVRLKNKQNITDKESLILIWEYLVLLVKFNGVSGHNSTFSVREKNIDENDPHNPSYNVSIFKGGLSLYNNSQIGPVSVTTALISFSPFPPQLIK